VILRWFQSHLLLLVSLLLSYSTCTEFLLSGLYILKYSIIIIIIIIQHFAGHGEGEVDTKSHSNEATGLQMVNWCEEDCCTVYI
jgi:hypothetical protein